MPIRINVTDSDQSKVESAAFDSGIAVFTGDGNRRLVSGGNGGAERVASDGAVANTKRAGVVYQHDDKFGSFESDSIGRRLK